MENLNEVSDAHPKFKRLRLDCILLTSVLVLSCGGSNGKSKPIDTGSDHTAATEWRGYSEEEIKTYTSQLDLLNWDDGGEISRFAFLNTSSLFPTRRIRSGGMTSALDYAPQSPVAKYLVSLNGEALPFSQYVDRASIDGIVILHRGKIAYEHYPRMRPTDHHLLFSLSKVYVSTVIAILEDQGHLSTAEHIENYIPELSSSGWNGVTIRDIVDMASGIDSPEWVDGAYTDPNRKHYQYEASLGWLPTVDSHPKSVLQGSTYNFLATLDRASEPGKRFEYVSVNSAILAWMVEKLTGKSFAEVLSEKIWNHIGSEDDALIAVNESGIAAAHAGIIAKLRDVARFGLAFTPSRLSTNGQRIASEAYLNKIQFGGRPALMEHSGYGEQKIVPRYVSYQWQVYEDGSFFKGGFGGQGLYVDPARDIVLAFVGTHGYREEHFPSPLEVCLKMFSAIY